MKGTKYVKATLWLARDDMSFPRRFVLEISGLRLTQSLLESEAVQAAVSAMWGEDVAKALAVDATVVLGPTETESARHRVAALGAGQCARN
jgi:hypothetical protein